MQEIHTDVEDSIKKIHRLIQYQKITNSKQMLSTKENKGFSNCGFNHSNMGSRDSKDEDSSRDNNFLIILMISP
jgi:hypothetical protein